MSKTFTVEDLIYITQMTSMGKKYSNFMTNSKILGTHLDNITMVECCRRNQGLGLAISFKAGIGPKAMLLGLQKDLPFITDAAINTAIEKFGDLASDDTYLVSWTDGEDRLRFYYTPFNPSVHLEGYNINQDGTVEYFKEYRSTINRAKDPVLNYIKYKNGIKVQDVLFHKMTYRKDKHLIAITLKREDGQIYTQYILNPQAETA